MKKFPQEQAYMLQMLISLMQEDKQSHFHSANPKVNVFVLDTSHLAITHQNKLVKNMRYIIESYENTDVPDTLSNQMFIVLGFEDGTKMMVNYTADSEAVSVAYLQTLQSLFLEHGRSDICNLTQTTKKLPWLVVSQETAYQKTDLTQYYATLYKMYAQHILQVIAADHANRPVMLVEPGCGDGRCSKFISDYIQKHTAREVHAAGFDINAENITTAKAKFPATEQFFIRCDFSEIGSFFNDLQPLSNRLDNPLTIVIFSGVLCNLVAEGSRQSLRMIQYACRDLSPILTVLGNHTDSYVTNGMITRTGMQISEQGIGPKKTEVYFLQPQSAEPFICKQISWSDKRAQDGRSKNNLDLSMSVDPIKTLQNIARLNATRLQTVTQLDLSDALLKPNELAEAAKEVHLLLPNLARVLFTKTDDWAMAFSELLSTYFPNMSFLNRLDSPDSKTLPPFSVPMARDMKLFKTMPNEPLILPQTKAQLTVDVQNLACK